MKWLFIVAIIANIISIVLSAVERDFTEVLAWIAVLIFNIESLMKLED